MLTHNSALGDTSLWPVLFHMVGGKVGKGSATANIWCLGV